MACVCCIASKAQSNVGLHSEAPQRRGKPRRSRHVFSTREVHVNGGFFVCNDALGFLPQDGVDTDPLTAAADPAFMRGFEIS